MTTKKEQVSLDGWTLTNDEIFHRENYSVVTGHSNDYTVVDPVGNVIRGDALHPIYTAISTVNNLISNLKDTSS